MRSFLQVHSFLVEIAPQGRMKLGSAVGFTHQNSPKTLVFAHGTLVSHRFLIPFGTLRRWMQCSWSLKYTSVLVGAPPCGTGYLLVDDGLKRLQFLVL